MKVNTVTITDVREKKQLYLIIGEGEAKVIINVGEKTFNAVNKLIEADIVNELNNTEKKEVKNGK